MATITWNGPELEGILREQMVKRLRTAAEVVKSAVLRSIRISFLAHGPSAPFDPPHMRMGMRAGLMGSIFAQTDPATLTAVVGTTKKYGLWLETGTRRMWARPFLRPALYSNHKRIAAILSKPLPGVG